MATRRTRSSTTTKTKRASSKTAARTAKAHDEPASAEGGAKGVPRALWTGSIGFGLLQIPVSLHTASATQELRFHQLDDRTLDPIGYKRVNKTTGEEVEWEHIVRGYEVEKGEFVVITDEDMQAADVEATQTIDIVDFVEREAVQPVWFDKPYYLAPLKRAERAYALFREALVRTNRVAIAKVVIRTRQHLAMVYPHKRALVLEILRWSHELRSPKGLDLPEEDLSSLKVGDRELEMAEELVTRMSSDWDPARYTDDYREAVLQMIEEKARSGKVTEVRHPTEREAPAKASDLVALLRKSLESTGDEKTGKKKGRAA
ncbi:Ku protein [Sandaracinus amylolyticus]|uniref:Non-homologous end joining protein Ku n=1 Tax=Sandaracinus amylolyticus TaxID=927083 RepID=A0A0F6W4S8_9BACT|nr:Ku protein [Sandaracinus amylolyticus]AKF07411.1 Ku domain protein [Sandaracinus amylolyticus]